MSAVSGWSPGLAGRASRLEELLEPADRRYTGLLRFWEDWISFALLAVSQLAFALSIARANWVDEMPALPVATGLGLVVGTVLARIRVQPFAMFPLGLAIGFAVSVSMVMQTMELSNPLLGDGIATRWSELWARMGDWLNALITGGVSSDPLPFVLLMVFVVWIVPYVAAWAVFRWQNAWLALVPAGFALLTNISYLPGKPSLEFMVFLFAAILLFARIHLLRTIRSWRGQQIAIPHLLSLEVVHASAWVAVGLILVAWVIPAGNNWEPAAGAWNDAIRPVTDRVDRFGQVFIGIDGKGSQLIHQFEGALPLQGRVKLDDDTMFIVSGEVGTVPHLRAAVYDSYDRSGWRLSDTERVRSPGTTVEAASFGTPETREQFRRPIAVAVFVESPLSDRRLLAVGDPLASDVEAEFLTGASPDDVVGLRPDSRIEPATPTAPWAPSRWPIPICCCRQERITRSGSSSATCSSPIASRSASASSPRRSRAPPASRSWPPSTSRPTCATTTPSTSRSTTNRRAATPSTTSCSRARRATSTTTPPRWP